jgi:hypothetical protein
MYVKLEKYKYKHKYIFILVLFKHFRCVLYDREQNNLCSSWSSRPTARMVGTGALSQVCRVSGDGNVIKDSHLMATERTKTFADGGSKQ